MAKNNRQQRASGGVPRRVPRTGEETASSLQDDPVGAKVPGRDETVAPPKTSETGASASRPTTRTNTLRRPSKIAVPFDLSPDDEAIPYSEIPYVKGDLVRVAATATVMFVIIIVAAIVVTRIIS